MSIADLPAFMASTWGIPVIMAQAMLTAAILLGLIIPTVMFTRGNGKIASVLSMFMLFLGVFMSAAMGWLDPGAMVLFILAIAAIFALFFGKLLGD